MSRRKHDDAAQLPMWPDRVPPQVEVPAVPEIERPVHDPVPANRPALPIPETLALTPYEGSYGLGTRSYNRSTYKRQWDETRKEYTARWEREHVPDSVPVTMLCTCREKPYPHDPHTSELSVFEYHRSLREKVKRVRTILPAVQRLQNSARAKQRKRVRAKRGQS